MPKRDKIKVNESIFEGFDVDEQVKQTIAMFYFRDAYELMMRGFDSHDRIITLSWKAKIFVDFLMSIECSLKSSIVSLSEKNEKPEDVYKFVRRKNHNLIELVAEFEKRAKNKVNLSEEHYKDILKQASILGVAARYSLDVFGMQDLIMEAENTSSMKRLSKSIDNEKWMRRLADSSRYLYERAGEAMRIFKYTRVLQGKQIKERNDRLTVFYDKVLKKRA